MQSHEYSNIFNITLYYMFSTNQPQLTVRKEKRLCGKGTFGIINICFYFVRIPEFK